jgi:hypothetical protein
MPFRFPTIIRERPVVKDTTYFHPANYKPEDLVSWHDILPFSVAWHEGEKRYVMKSGKGSCIGTGLVGTGGGKEFLQMPEYLSLFMVWDADGELVFIPTIVEIGLDLVSQKGLLAGEMVIDVVGDAPTYLMRVGNDATRWMTLASEHPGQKRLSICPFVLLMDTSSDANPCRFQYIWKETPMVMVPPELEKEGG